MEKTVRHLGIIMDGNRRWAKERGLPTFEGHRRGAKKLAETVKWCVSRQIGILTCYAFSTENWQRDKKEVSFLLKLAGRFIDYNIEELHKEGVKVKVLGNMNMLPHFLVSKIKKARELTEHNKGITINLLFDYGGRDEIIRAVKKAILWNGVNPNDLTEEKIADCLDTAGLPDPDLIIRTSGEQRTSGFLLWQSAYSELYFTKKYWPDFSEEDLDAALAEYGRRQRRFGK